MFGCHRFTAKVNMAKQHFWRWLHLNRLFDFNQIWNLCWSTNFTWSFYFLFCLMFIRNCSHILLMELAIYFE